MASFGETLKRERELREISLREISDATKINIRYLEALETNRFDKLPGGLFNKGFIRAYATFIGVDSETMVTSYLHEVNARESGASGPSDEAPSALHRPAETPRRRATGSPADATHHARAGPLPTRTPPPAQAPQLAITGIERSTAAAAARSSSAADGAGTPPSSISASRVLWGIVSLVAAAAAMLLVLSLVMPRQQADNDHLAATGASSGLRPAQPPEAAGSNVEPEAPPIPIDDQRAGTALPSIAAMTAPAAQSTPRPARTPRPAAPPPPTATPVPREPVVPLQAPGDESPAPPETRDGSPGPMSLRVEARGRTWVQLTCDSREAINWVMRAGDQETMDCLRIIRVSAADAAAVSLQVNGAACLPLGETGERVYGYTIRIDDFGTICPGSRRGRNG